MRCPYDKKKMGLARYKRQCARRYREPPVWTTPPTNVRLGGQIPRSACVAQGFPRIGDFARGVQRLRAKRTVLRSSTLIRRGGRCWIP